MLLKHDCSFWFVSNAGFGDASASATPVAASAPTSQAGASSAGMAPAETSGAAALGLPATNAQTSMFGAPSSAQAQMLPIPAGAMGAARAPARVSFALPPDTASPSAPQETPAVSAAPAVPSLGVQSGAVADPEIEQAVSVRKFSFGGRKSGAGLAARLSFGSGAAAGGAAAETPPPVSQAPFVLPAKPPPSVLKVCWFCVASLLDMWMCHHVVQV